MSKLALSPLTCDSCGAQLAAPEECERVTCASCSARYDVTPDGEPSPGRTDHEAAVAALEAQAEALERNLQAVNKSGGPLATFAVVAGGLAGYALGESTGTWIGIAAGFVLAVCATIQRTKGLEERIRANQLRLRDVRS